MDSMLGVISENTYGILLATLLGAFLGLRREIQEKNDNGFMGLRTMALISMLGAISAVFPDVPYLPAIVFTGFFILIAVVYWHGAFVCKKVGLTAEISALITFWIGVLSVMPGTLHLAILIAVVLAVVDTYKKEVRNFSDTLDTQEWRGALQLVIFTVVILPILPKTAVDPWGVLVPYNIWFLILLISGIGFFGYLLTKYWGDRVGIILTAFLGGISSSTAVTVALAEKAKDQRKVEDLRVGILIAIATMQMRVMIVVALLGLWFLQYDLLIALSGMVAVEAVFCVLYWKTKERQNVQVLANQEELKLESPFDIMPAVKFGLVFVFISFAVYFGQIFFGSWGVYVASFLSGLVDVDAIVLSCVEALNKGEMTVQVVCNAIILAVVMNTVIKIFYVALLGTRDLAYKLLPSVITASAVGAVLVQVF